MILMAGILFPTLSVRASPTELHVGPGQTYATITAAIAAASSGDTIIVHAGTYPESVSVSKDNIRILSNTLHGALVGPLGAGNCFTVTANYVTIDGFELAGTTSGSGISFSGSHNTFSNNKIHSIDCGGTGGGIVCWDTGSMGPSNYNTISNNEIYDVTADGILTGCCRADAVMDGNVITGNKIHNFATKDGWNPAIEEVNGKNYVISNNEITGSTTQYYGILHTSWNGIPQSGNTISENIIHSFSSGGAICIMADTGEGSGCGGVIHGFTAPAEVVLKDSVIEGNNLYENRHGIILDAYGGDTTKATISGIEILGNNIHDNLNKGIYFYTRCALDSIKNSIIQGNDLVGNQVGTKVWAMTSGGTLTGNTFNYNNIHGNTLYGIEESAAGTLIDAENNWWGSGGTGADEGKPGVGGNNDVSGNVDYTPWLVPGTEQQTGTATGTGTAKFNSDTGAIADVTPIDEATLPTAGKPDIDFPHGFFSFYIAGLTPGATVTVTITLPSAVPVGTQYWKYHASEGGWIQIPMGSDNGDNVITITLVDGGLGDDDGLANGIIDDQGGPGIPPSKPPVGGEVLPVDKLALLAPYVAAILVIAAGSVVIRRRKY